MPQPAGKSWWQSALVMAFVAAVLGLLVLGWFRTESMTARWIAGIFFAVCGGWYIYATIHDWIEDRRLRRLLQGREAVDPETFGARYFSDLPDGPKVAATVRRLL